MKKVAIALALLQVLFSNVVFGQQAKNDFFVHDGKSVFYLLMSVSDVHELLGTPVETLMFTGTDRPDTIMLRYPGITFFYIPIPDRKGGNQILSISIIGEQYQIGNINATGRSRYDLMGEIIEIYGEPHFTLISDEHTTYVYEFYFSPILDIALKFRFNRLGICDGVALTHGSFFN
jgi:hypothetical protein